MDQLLIETWVAFVIYTGATILNFVRGRRGRVRQYHFYITAIICLYVTVVYGLALGGVLHIRNIGPDYLRPASILIGGSLVANAVAYWKTNGS